MGRRALQPADLAGDVRYSILSLALAASTVCHCMLEAASGPPRFSATTWSITYPGQVPLERPVDGHGFSSLNVAFAAALRRRRPRASSVPDPGSVQDPTVRGNLGEG